MGKKIDSLQNFNNSKTRKTSNYSKDQGGDQNKLANYPQQQLQNKASLASLPEKEIITTEERSFHDPIRLKPYIDEL